MNTSTESNKGIRQFNKVLAGIALVIGLGIGLLALFAALGVWFGWWDFRQGFNFLRTANDYGDLIALGGLIITVLVFILGKKSGQPETGKLTALALVGTIAAGLAWYVPETYRPGEGVNIPPIHDIATDTSNPAQFVDVLPLRGPGTNTTDYGNWEGMTPAEQARLQQEAYPDIQPQHFTESREVIFERALAAVNELGWDLVAQEPEEGRIEATDTTFWFRFKDDVVIIVSETPEGSVLNARSTSRVGRSDVGKNAARLRNFFALLHDQ